MEYNLKICFFEKESGAFLNNINYENLKNLSFDSSYHNGSSQDLMKILSLEKFDILVINAFNADKERLNFAINILYNNFCKNILLIGYERLCDYQGVDYLVLKDLDNFDLKLELSLMNKKREIQSCPSKNMILLKSKVCSMLNDFQFSSRHDGFKYYTDCVLLAYMKRPYDYSTMELYKEVALMYGKTYYSVEKSMRTALLYAFNKLRLAPQTDEYNKLRSYLTYDLNNNTCISMMVDRLINDDEIREDIILNF